MTDSLKGDDCVLYLTAHGGWNVPDEVATVLIIFRMLCISFVNVVFKMSLIDTNRCFEMRHSITSRVLNGVHTLIGMRSAKKFGIPPEDSEFLAESGL